MILDIIGYWGSVTIITAFLLTWVLFPLNWVINSFITEVFKGVKGVSPPPQDWLLEQEWQNDRYLLLGERFQVNDLFLLVWSVIGAAAFIFVSIGTISPRMSMHDVTNFLHTISTHTASTVSWMIILWGGYRGLVFICRKLVTVSSKLKTIEERINGK